MPAGDLVAADWQIEYRGLLLGDGTPYDLVQIEGVLDQPETRTADRTRLRRHGLTPGDDFLAGRTVTLTLEIEAGDAESFNTRLVDLARALRPGDAEEPLVLRLPGVAGGGKRRLLARPRRRSLPVNLDFYYRLPTALVEFTATDPRLYDADASNATSTLPTAGGGANFPLSFPVGFGAVGVGGALTAVNAGTFATPPLLRIDGPVTNPRVEHLTSGRTLELTLTLAAGEWVELDADARTVLLGGTASRYSALTPGSTWWDLEPGPNELTFRAATPTAALLTVTWRSAWV